MQQHSIYKYLQKLNNSYAPTGFPCDESEREYLPGAQSTPTTPSTEHGGGMKEEIKQDNEPMECSNNNLNSRNY